jgi:hypothetical protein
MPMPESLGRAERSMREAEDALKRGDPREASRSQRRALDNLQQGMGDMAEQMRQRGPGNGQDLAEIEERERRSEDRDPLGRSDGNYGDAVDTGVDKAPAQPRDPGRAAPPRRRAAAAEGRARLHRPAAQDVLIRDLPGGAS